MKKIASIIAVLMAMVCFTGCLFDGPDENSVEGKWEFCGIVEEGQECCLDNAIIDQAYLDKFQLEEMPDKDITIDEKGITYLRHILGADAEKAEFRNKRNFTQKVTFSKLNNETLKKPLVQTNTVKYKDGYLFVTITYDSKKYTGGDTCVYRRK